MNTWVYRVALNTAISFARRRKHTTVSIEQPEKLPLAGNSSDSLYLLEEFLLSLNKVNRSVLLMYLDGLNHTEIGTVLGRRPNAVAVRLNRIKKDFEKRYVEDVI